MAKKRVKKWMQEAVSEETEGDFTQWCRRQGFKGVCQACINAAAKKGGRPAKMALFAANANPERYSYPKKEKKGFAAKGSRTPKKKQGKQFQGEFRAGLGR